LKGPFIARLTNPYQLQSFFQFKLQRNSPLKDQGLDLQVLFHIPYPQHDLYGNKVPQGNSAEPGVHELEE
jgi:hypothetical protein